MLIEEPYFMKNDDWWSMNKEETMIILTPKAPIDKEPKILKSYREYLRQHEYGKKCRGGMKAFDFDIDDDKAFEKFMNEMMKDL